MSSSAQAREFTLTYTMDVPAAEVFRGWTDPEHLDWFYNDTQPKPNEPIEVDLRVGGAWRQYMVIDEDTSYFTGGIYRDIEPNEKLVFTWGAVGGWPEIDPERLDDCPLVTVTLKESGGRTRMTVHVELPAAFVEGDNPPGFLDHVEAGMRDTIDRLVADVAAHAEVTVGAGGGQTEP
jgi:uncharacterized protein YndB with AHSA1/START domain